MSEQPAAVETSPPGGTGPKSGDPSAGRDEMNLAEFPLTLLADRAPRESKTLRSVGRQGSLVVTGSDAYGLPTASDADVIIGLIQLTRLRNEFTEPKVRFSRYELLRIIGWPDETRYYRRLDESLNRWVGVTLHYQSSWWDNRSKRYLSAKMHILESVVLDEKPGRRGRDSAPSSWFSWNALFIESCQADNLKRLDLDAYFAFRSAVTKRMYRFLDKRFYLRPDWTFELKEFAFDFVGLSRSYEGNAGKIKEKLRPALEELEEAGFLEPLPRPERYERDGETWRIRLVQGGRLAVEGAGIEDEADEATSAEGEGSDLAELVARGVTLATARELVEEFPPERIGAKLAAFDWLVSRKDRRVARSPAGYLVDSIRKDYSPPKGFDPARAEAPMLWDPPASREAAEAAEAAAEAARWARVERHLATLDPAGRERLTAEAIASASSFLRNRYAKLRESDPARAEPYLRAILAGHLAGRIGE